MKEKKGVWAAVRRFFGDHACIAGLILMVVIATSINDSFLKIGNISNVLRQISTTSIAALGMAVVIICGSIDLSVGSLYAVTAFLAAHFAQRGALVGVLAALIFGTFIGFLNGIIIVKLHVHQWITTLSMMLALRGLVLILTGENTYKPAIKSAAFEAIADFNILTYLNWPILIMVFLTIAISIFLRYTNAGREIYATGSNHEAARMMGAKVDGVMIRAHMISGFCTAVSGILLASRVDGSVSPLVGDGLETYAIAACVVGGVHLSGGRGQISNVFVGGIIVGMLTNIFNMQQTLSTFWEPVITGTLVLVVVLVQRIIVMRAERMKKVTEVI